MTSPTATDNCEGSITGSHDATLPITTQGTTTVTWTYDDGNGNTSTQMQSVVIEDVTAPVADVASLSDITAECEVTSLTSPTATDNCAGSITGMHDATLPITTQGTTTVTWTYDDGNGNTSTQMQSVVIEDITAPVADVASLPDVESECEVTSLTSPTATDNCEGSITGMHDATLPITTQGTTTVTWTYDDGNGNTSTQMQSVVIEDITAPVADVASLPDVESECEVTSLTSPTATDNCAGSITGTHDATLPITTQGTTTVTWTYDDGNGNTSTQTQDVVIDDVTAPVLTLSGDLQIILECDSTYTELGFTATDNCSGTPNVNVIMPAGFGDPGTYVIKYVATDASGNESDTMMRSVTFPEAEMCDLVDCVDELILTAGYLAGTHRDTFKAAIVLKSNGNITAGENLIFKAGDSIILEPDFQVEIGATLEVSIESCTETLNLTADQYKRLVKDIWPLIEKK